MTNKKETAQEVPVQEQPIKVDIVLDGKEIVNNLSKHSIQEQSIVFSFDENLLDEKLERINRLSRELMDEINSLPKTIISQNS